MAKSKFFNSGQIELIQTAYGLSPSEIETLNESKVRSLSRKIAQRDRPRSRAQFARLLAQDDGGEIADGAVENAFRQLDSARTQAASKAHVAGIPCGMTVTPEALLSGPSLPGAAGVNNASQWVALGPGNVGGRTRGIVISPSAPNTIWLGSSGGGVWRTDDGGISWSPVDDRMANLAICCLTMSPQNEKVIYAGTGEGFNNVDAIRGTGIFVTTDQVHWKLIPATNNPNFHYVNRIAVSRNGKTILAGTSRPHKASPQSKEGIYLCSDPNRAVWTRVLDEQIADVKFDPTNNKKAIAGGLNNGASYYSTNGGRSWKQSKSPHNWQGRVELCYSAKDSSIVYASVDTESGTIFRSSDGGKTFKARKSKEKGGGHAGFLGQQGWYDNTIWAGDPTDENLVVVGGIDLWRSTDGGNSLKKISKWNENSSVHADHHAIVSHPDYNGTNQRIVFFGNDGGIYKTKNVRTAGGGAQMSTGWVNLVNGYAVTQFYGAAGNASTGTIVGGTQDNGTLAYTPVNGAQAWVTIQGGDGGYCAADQNNPKRFYGEYTYLSLFRNTNGAADNSKWWENYIDGQFWNGTTNQWEYKPIPYRIPDSQNERALFIAPFALDPNNSDRILAGGESLWRSNDIKTTNTNSSGPSWRAIKSSIGSEVYISSIAIAEGKSDTVWVGYSNGDIAYTSNGTNANPSWTNIKRNGNNPLTPRRLSTRIVIDPSDHQTVFALFGGYVSNNVWKSVDGGKQWANIGASLPEAPARTLVIHPRKSNYLYLGTEVGVFTSEDGGSSWSPTNEGPTNCAVAELFWMKESLVCATHGRGLFSIDLSQI